MFRVRAAIVGVVGGVDGTTGSGSSAGRPAFVSVTMSPLVARTFLRLGSPRMFFSQRNVRKRPLPDLVEAEATEELEARAKFREDVDLKDFFFFLRNPIEGQAEALALAEEVEGQVTAVSGSTGSLPLLARKGIASDEGAESSGTTTAGLTLLLLLLLLMVVVLANDWFKFALLTVL